MLLKDFVTASRISLEKLYPQGEASAIVSALCSEVLGLESYELISHPDAVIDDTRLDTLLQAAERLYGGEPLQYVTGHAWFYGRRFDVNPSVLIPRPETELLCRNVIEEIGLKSRAFCQCGNSSMKILDLCTGSGCIAWTLSLELPGIELYAADISEDALKTASSQVFDTLSSSSDLDLSGQSRALRPHFVKADIFDRDALRGALPDGIRFDVIVSNPPYVLESEKGVMGPNVLEHEPSLALFVPDDRPQIFNRAIADICLEFLQTDGFCIVEINETLGGDTSALFDTFAFRNVSVLKDLSGRDRFVSFSRQ